MSIRPEYLIHPGDAVTVTFADAVPAPLSGTFIRWFPSETATSFQMLLPDGVTPTQIIYVKDYAYVTKTYVAP
jgi:hypothetical protein